MKELVSLPARTEQGVLVVVETPAGSRGEAEARAKAGSDELEAAHGDAPRDVFAFSERLRTGLEDFFVWSTRWEKKDLRFLGWSGIEEAEQILSAPERAARR